MISLIRSRISSALTFRQWEHLTPQGTLTKLTGVGRHVSPERRRSLRGRVFLALIAIVVLICVAAFAVYRIWDHAREGSPAPHARPTAARSTAGAVTLALTVTGPRCQVFVRVPDGDILVNRELRRGQSLRFDEPRLNVVLGDGSAARVYVDGRLRPPDPPGRRVAFDAVKN